jgi:hypothetical protein
MRLGADPAAEAMGAEPVGAQIRLLRLRVRFTFIVEGQQLHVHFDVGLGRAGSLGMANTWHGRFPWENLKARAGTVQVKDHPPNSYGLFEMAGNVWEWTSDYFTAGTPHPSMPAAGRKIHVSTAPRDGRSPAARRAHSAAGRQRRLLPVRPQLLLSLPARSPAGPGSGNVISPHRLPLRAQSRSRISQHRPAGRPGPARPGPAWAGSTAAAGSCRVPSAPPWTARSAAGRPGLPGQADRPAARRQPYPRCGPPGFDSVGHSQHRGQQEPGVGVEDLVVQLGQRWPGLDAELLDQCGPATPGGIGLGHA